MKKTAKLCVAVLSLSTLASVASAATPGVYAGLGLGYSRQETPNQFLTPKSPLITQSRTIGGLGGKIFAGYNFNKYVGVEANLAQYAQSKYKASNVFGNASLNYKMTALDVVGKGYLPISDSGVNLYGLGGVALVHNQVSGKVNSIIGDFSGSHTQNTVRPIVGAGVSYDIPSTQLTTSLEFSHIIGRGNVKTSDKAVPSADLATINLAYNFG